MRNRRIAIWIGVFCLFCVGILGFFLTRTYQNPQTNSEIFSEHLDNEQPNFIERIVGNIPEILQMKLITTFAPFYHGMFSSEEAQRMWSTSAPLYQEMQKSEKWSHLPSSLSDTYLSILHFHPKQNQYLVYMPQHPTGQKLPVIVFLHGFGGNFTSYVYQLSHLADMYQVAIIAPTYKNGIWDNDSMNFIHVVTQDAAQKFDIDLNHEYLMGISNGGLILPDLYKNDPIHYQGLIFFSTYLDKKVLLQPDMLSSLKNVKMLVIQGNQDERIDPENTWTVVTELKRNRVDISLNELPSDHFLFFEKNEPVFQIIGKTFFGSRMLQSRI